jgi:hypothetical protein
VKIHKQIGAVYGDIVYWQNVTEYCELSDGRIEVHNEQRSEWPSLISVDLLHKTEGEIRVNQQRMVRGLCYTEEGYEFLDSILEMKRGY